MVRTKTRVPFRHCVRARAPGLDRDRIRKWYNGCGWRGAERVYNPFDILLLFRSREFGAWWFETGTPTFLVETLFRRRVSALSLDGMLGNGVLVPRPRPAPGSRNAYDGIAQAAGHVLVRPAHHHADTMDGKTMTVTPEAWTVIGTGVVIPIAIAASNRQLQTELNQVHAEIGQLRERMAKLEGLLEWLREAITGRKVA